MSKTKNFRKTIRNLETKNLCESKYHPESDESYLADVRREIGKNILEVAYVCDENGSILSPGKIMELLWLD